MSPTVLVLLDYDDTLLPSTFLLEASTKGLMRSTAAAIEATKELLRLDLSAVSLIEGILDPFKRKPNSSPSLVIKLIIISNGHSVWVQSSIREFMPRLHDFLELNKNKIDVISSRDAYSTKYPEDIEQWKMQSFRDEVFKVLLTSKTHQAVNCSTSGSFMSCGENDTTRSSDAQLTMETSSSTSFDQIQTEQSESPIKKCARSNNDMALQFCPGSVAFNHKVAAFAAPPAEKILVLSIGDGMHERSASLALCNIDGVRVLSLKLLDALCPDELCKELTFVSESLGCIFDLGLSTLRNAIDLVVVRAAEPQFDIVHYAAADDDYNDDDDASMKSSAEMSLGNSQQTLSHSQSQSSHLSMHSPLVIETKSEESMDKTEMQLHSISYMISESESEGGVAELASTESGMSEDCGDYLRFNTSRF